MNKKSRINLLLSLAILVLLLISFVKSEGIGIFSMLGIDLFISLTVIMFYRRNLVKKLKFFYDVILLLMMFFSIMLIGYFAFAIISSLFNYNISYEYSTLVVIIFPLLNFNIIFFSLNNIKSKTNKNTDLLTILVSLIIILIFTRYFIDPNFISNNSIQDFQYYKIQYLWQNLMYATILYFLVSIHYFVNKVS